MRRHKVIRTRRTGYRSFVGLVLMLLRSNVRLRKAQATVKFEFLLPLKWF